MIDLACGEGILAVRHTILRRSGKQGDPRSMADTACPRELRDKRFYLTALVLYMQERSISPFAYQWSWKNDFVLPSSDLVLYGVPH